MFKLKLTPLENQLKYVAMDIQEKIFRLSFNDITFSNDLIVGLPYIHIRPHRHTIQFDNDDERDSYITKVLTSAKELGGYVTITGDEYTIHM
jgi:hypothetical protein